MLNFLKTNPVRKEVLKLIDEKLTASEQEYQFGVLAIESERQQKIVDVNTEAETKKTQLLKDTVKSVISTLLN